MYTIYPHSPRGPITISLGRTVSEGGRSAPDTLSIYDLQMRLAKFRTRGNSSTSFNDVCKEYLLESERCSCS